MFKTAILAVTARRLGPLAIPWNTAPRRLKVTYVVLRHYLLVVVCVDPYWPLRHCLTEHILPLAR